MNLSVEIRVGDVFTTSALDVGLARLLVVSRQIAVIFALIKEQPKPKEVPSERLVVLLAYYIATLKELVDAFDYLNSTGIATILADETNALTDLRDATRSAIKHLDKKTQSRSTQDSSNAFGTLPAFMFNCRT